MKEITHNILLKLTICFFILCFGESAYALAIFNSENEFLEIAPITSTETFDEFPPGTGFPAITVIDNVIYETEAFDPESGDPVDPYGPILLWTAGINIFPGAITQPNDFGSRNIATNWFTFGSGKFVEAFGFWFISHCTALTRAWEIVIEELDGKTSLVDINCEENIVLPNYYGFLSDIGISKVIIRDFKGDSGARNWSYDNVSRSEIEIETLSILNDFVSFDPDPLTYLFTPDTTDCQSGAVGKFSFDATLTNISEKELSNLNVEVDELANNNLLLTDNGLIGEGGRFAVPEIDDYDDGILSHEEYVDVPFTVCLQEKSPFRFFVNVLGVAEDIDLEKRLVAYYPFNGNANDESGNGNHGTVHGADLTEDRFGNPDSAYSFDGIDNFIDIDDAGNLSFDARNQNYSVSLWFLANSITHTFEPTIIIDRNTTNNTPSSYQTQFRDALPGTLQADAWDGASGPSLYGNTVHELGTWYHVAFVARNAVAYFYVNGVLEDTDPFNVTNTTKNTEGTTIGRWAGGFFGQYFMGKIDDIRIYNRALSEDEIKALYNLGN